MSVMLSFINVPAGFYRLYLSIASYFGDLKLTFLAMTYVDGSNTVILSKYGPF